MSAPPSTSPDRRSVSSELVTTGGETRPLRRDSKRRRGSTNGGALVPAIARVACGVITGLMMVAAFPPYGWWWLAPLAVAGLAIITYAQGIVAAAGYGFIHGLAFFTPLLYWTGSYVGPVPWLLLALVESLYFAPLGAALAWVSRQRLFGGVARLSVFAVGVSCLWVAQEAVRGRVPWGGFPWGRLAFSQADSSLVRFAAVAGAPAVSFAVALCGGLLAAAVIGFVERLVATRKRDSQRHRWWWPAAAPALSAVLVAAALLVPLAAAGVPVANPQHGRAMRVAVVQGNVPRAGLGFNDQRRAVLDRHVHATLLLARAVRAGHHPKPDIVVWPENAADIDPLTNPDAYERISAAVRAIGVPVLVGAVLDGPGTHVFNAGLVWTPDHGPGHGPTQRYIKQHPVPFAEYVPYRSFFRHFSSQVDLVRREFLPGHHSGVLRLGPATVADVICFEVAYDGLVTTAVRGGGQLLVVQTNNATFGRSPESAQQMAMVRLRAIEHGRYAVMASTSGVSGMVAPDGTVLATTAMFTQTTLNKQLRVSTRSTLATRVGAWPELVVALLGALLAALVWLTRPQPPGWRRLAATVNTILFTNGAVAVPSSLSSEGTPMSTPSADATPTTQSTPPSDAALTVSPEASQKDQSLEMSSAPDDDAAEPPRIGRVLVVIPTYNEADNLELIVGRLRAAAPDVDVLVADDNSPDGTGKLADELASADDQIHVMHRAGKQGLGAAYIAGFRWACDNEYDVVVEMDADGSHAPEQLADLLSALADHDVVIGARWVPGGTVVNWPWHRKVISRVGNFYTRLALGLPLKDATGGYRAYRRTVLDRLELDGVASQGYCFQVDLTWRASQAGFRLGEVPITFTERERGDSKMSSSIILEALWRVTMWGVDVRWRRLRGVLARSQDAGGSSSH